MAEVRTTSSTGGQKGVKSERHDLLPREGIEAIARVFSFGAEKYADHNWRKGYEWGKSYAALQRHLHAFWSGETYDEESGLPHLAHAGFHVLVLLTWLEQDGDGSQFDDRYRPESQEEVKLGPDVMWQIPETVTFQAVETSLETIALATGVSVEELQEQARRRETERDPYAWPLRFIAGTGRMDCAVKPFFDSADHFVVEQDVEIPVRDIPTRPEGMTFEEWQDEKVRRADEADTWAANIVTGQGVNGVQRSFDLKD